MIAGSRKIGISAAVLKNVALVTMLIDHLTAYLWKAHLLSEGVTDLYSDPLYSWGRIIGRIAFVLYAFMIAEGACHTRNKLKYFLRLMALAVISEIPLDLASSDALIDMSDQNIFFMLALGLVTIYAYQWITDRCMLEAGDSIKPSEGNTKKGGIMHSRMGCLCIILRLLLIAAACWLAEILHIEYGSFGVLLIMIFYIHRDHIYQLMISAVVVSTVGYALHIGLKYPSYYLDFSDPQCFSRLIRSDRIQLHGILALPFIFFYNGEKGRQLPKYFYYFFYPAHLLVIWLIKMLAF